MGLAGSGHWVGIGRGQQIKRGELMQTVPNWNGDEVSFAKSKGGVLAFVDPLGGLLRGDAKMWPPPEIIQKLFKSGLQRHYPYEDREAIEMVLGYYCNLQSIHSEDAITWNVFGPLIYTTEATRVDFCTQLFHLIEPSLPSPQAVEISLWRRAPHPETFVSGGPEIDFFIQTPEVVVIGEAKWSSSEGTGQGKKKNKGQIQLRKEIFETLGPRIYAAGTTFVVLGIHLDEPVVQHKACQMNDVEILLRSVSWESVCSIKPHPTEDELPKYFKWKKEHTSRYRKKTL